MNQEQLQQIIFQMIKTEFTAMHFYRKAASCLLDEGARFHFELLAAEEREHAQSFFDLQSGITQADFENLEKHDPDDVELIDVDYDHLASFSELEALETALLLEREMERVLLELASPIDNDHAREIIFKNIESTRGHILLIREDIERLREDICLES